MFTIMTMFLMKKSKKFLELAPTVKIVTKTSLLLEEILIIHFHIHFIAIFKLVVYSKTFVYFL